MKGLKEMRRLCIRALAVMLVVIVALVSVTQPLLAKQPDNPLPGSKIEREYTRAINTLERYLSISETGNIVLNAPKRIVNSIDSEVYQSILAGLAQTNSMIDSGYLVANPDFTLTVTEKYLESNSQLRAEGNAVTLLSSSGGVNKVVWHWWGFEFYLSSSYVKWIAAGLYVGSIVAAFVPEPFASKVAAVLIGGLGVLLTSLDKGNGVIIQFIWPAIPVSVRPQ